MGSVESCQRKVAEVAFPSRTQRRLPAQSSVARVAGALALLSPLPGEDLVAQAVAPIAQRQAQRFGDLGLGLWADAVVANPRNAAVTVWDPYVEAKPKFAISNHLGVSGFPVARFAAILSISAGISSNRSAANP